MTAEPAAFFVYGTLKRGQSNYHLIAPAVRSAIPATIRGRLYDVGPFPALGMGDDTVHGELVTVETGDLPRLLALLDALEGYDPADPEGSMYRRSVVIATAADGSETAAFAYFYNREPVGLRQLPGGAWHGPSGDEVAPVSDELTDFGRRVREFRR